MRKFRDYLKEDKEQPMKIYIDMDGVLCDFDKGIFDIDGKTRPEDLEQDHPEKDLWKHIDKIGGPYIFYKNLGWHPEGVKLWEYLKNKPNIEILSSLGGNNPDKFSTQKGKEEWLRKNNINIPYNFSQRAVEKQKWVRGKNSILIDDYEPNITDWTRAGGTAIHFKKADDAINQLKKLSENIVIAPYVITPEDIK